MRFLRAVVIIVVILGGLFVGADRWAVGYADNRLAERIQARQGLAGSADVHIRGFPFLTQALSHDLEQVDVTLKGVDATADGRKARLTRLDAAFHGVKLNGDYSGGTARRAEGTAFVSYADLTEASQTGVTVAYGGKPGKVKVTARLQILGQSLTRSVISTVSLADAPSGKGKIVRVHADEVPGEGIPGIERVIRKETDFDRSIDGGLPAGLQLSTLTSDEEGVRLSLTGTDVVLAGS
ncbi:LmeA family phospholipid-binding protein [Streptomyces sp. NPDC054838]